MFIASCMGKNETLPKQVTFLHSNSTILSKDKIPVVDNCPNLDSAIYNNKWIRFPEGCSFYNSKVYDFYDSDSIFVINSIEIDFDKFIRLSKSKKIKDIASNVNKNIYSENNFELHIYLSIKLANAITGKNEKHGFYVDNFINGYVNGRNVNYILK